MVKKSISYGSIALIGGICMHSVVMFVEYMTFPQIRILWNARSFLSGLFSLHMAPMMFAYGILSLIAYIFWKKYKHELSVSYRKELVLQKEKAIIQNTQELTSVMAQHILVHNNEIKKWIETRKKSGNASQKVEQASAKIGSALEILSRMSYILPYTEENIENYTEYINNQLHSVSHGSTAEED